MVKPTNPSILIVEDEPDMRDNYRDLLSTLYTLTFAETGYDAIAAFQQAPQPFKAIILDINLPDMTGHNVVKQLEAISFIDLPPIIIVTAYGDPQDVIQSMVSSQAFLHLTKPFSTKEIRETIATAIQDPFFLRRNFELARDIQLDHWLSERNTKMLDELRAIKSQIGGFVTLKDVDPYVYHNKDIAKKNLPISKIFYEFEDDSGFSGPPIPTPKILLIENESDLLEILTSILENAGYHVLSTKDPFSGVNLLRDNPDLDIVLMDLRLPGLHGEEIIQELKSQLGWSDIVAKDTITNPDIVVYTAQADHETITSAIKAGASKYLLKPIAKQTLLDELHDVLLRRHGFKSLPKMLQTTLSQPISYRHRLMQLEDAISREKSTMVSGDVIRTFFNDIPEELVAAGISKSILKENPKEVIDRLRQFTHTELSNYSSSRK